LSKKKKPTLSNHVIANVPVDIGRAALDNLGLDKLNGVDTDEYEVWVRGNMPVYVPYALGDKTHFDGEAFANILAGK
jgi:hypothetical protein